MNIPAHIFKGYDIRAIYPTEIDEESIVQIVKAIYAFLSKDKKPDEPMTIVVGTDMRTSSPSLTKAAIDTLVSLGVQVVDIGMVSTPTFYFAVSHYGYEAGFQVTASHNPKEWNGVKIVKNSPKGLLKIGKPTGIEEIKEMALSGVNPEPKPGGSVTKKTGILEDEVENALKIVGHPNFDKFKIVADPANAMGSQYITALFERVPADLIKMNFELDGTFPVHQPDPLQFDTLKDLQARVMSEKANFGLAPDGDGDRLFFIDEKGQVIPGTLITALVAKDILREHPGETILFELRNIFTPKKIVEENGGKHIVTKVGHAYITESLYNSGGIFAGEGSAHYFFRDTGCAESQMPVILTVMKVMTREKKPLSEIIQELKRSVESQETNFRVSNAQEIMDAVKERYSDGEIDLMDGVTVAYQNWRMNLRTSNTEPLLRLNLEAYDQNVLDQKKQEVLALIESKAIKVESPNR